MRFTLLIVLLPVLLAASPVTGDFKLDNFGYRPGDRKYAFAVKDPAGRIEVRRAADDSVALVLGAGEILDRGQESGAALVHGDHVWRLDFSALTEAGTFRLVAPAWGSQSYEFRVAEDVYSRALNGVAKAFFWQRYGAQKDAAFGGPWNDAACHAGDAASQPLCLSGADYGAMNYGALDLSGGWHDAGDYEKKIGISNDCGQNAYADAGQTLYFLLSAYDANPGAFQDGDLNLPESGNGLPDLLDQAAWELDWYLKMQRPDGHVLAKLVVTNLGGFSSPPSADTNPRWYGPPTRQAEAIFTALMAHAARSFASAPGGAARAARYEAAALKTWDLWVKSAPPTDSSAWAAGEVFRLDWTRVEAKMFLESYKNWGGYVWMAPVSVLNYGVFQYLKSPGADPGVAAGMRQNWGRMADYILSNNDSYESGMPAWLWAWNSNWFKAECGLNLAFAAELGATGARTAQECRAHALDYLHYLHGANPLNMTYLSNAELLGAKHGVWRIFNVWFGYYSDAGSRGRYIGKPASVADPLFPYFSGTDNFGIRDDDASLHGPPPGYVPPGPTSQYASLGGKSRPPLQPDGSAAPLAKAYRDWNYSDATGTACQPWIVNEAGIYDLAALACPAHSGPAPTPLPVQPGPSGAPRGQLRVVPNPGSHSLQLRFDLGARADSAVLEVYSSAFTKAGRVEMGPLAAGAQNLAWEPGDWGNGVYFLKLVAGAETKTGNFYLAR